MTASNRLKGKKVLVVDDEVDILETMEGLLPECEITKASTFAEGKGLLASRHFDLAILDIMGVNGFELLDIANERKVISVMLTAQALSPESTVKAYKRGAAFFVPKDEMANITLFLEDVLKSSEKGENHWTTWLHHLEAYYHAKFGPGWKDKDREFWEALAQREWRLASVLREGENQDE
ncbi:MAG: response regulator [Deltaproteobacteria bacterium]|nr:response regulator [Deltaproteobacteria bacterium]